MQLYLIFPSVRWGLKHRGEDDKLGTFKSFFYYSDEQSRKICIEAYLFREGVEQHAVKSDLESHSEQ